MKKKLFLFWLGCVTLAGCHHANAAQDTRLPNWNRECPNYLTPNTCYVFAQECRRALNLRGIPARVIVSSGSSAHAACVFKLDDRYFYMDNSRVAPMRVPKDAKTDLSCFRYAYEGRGTAVYIVEDLNGQAGKRIDPHKLADLFAPSPDWFKHLTLATSPATVKP